MNATDTIFALALASNQNPESHFSFAYQQLAALGDVVFSSIYLIPCREGVGADYWNSACLLHSQHSVAEISQLLKKWEQQSGRVRPSHQIALDIDLIAWGNDLKTMQFNQKKMPLAQDVLIPLFDLWQNPDFQVQHDYPKVQMSLVPQAVS